MLYKFKNFEQEIAFQEWAKENNVQYEELPEGNYIEECPECGESEFWYDGHCGNCGYDI